MALFTCSNAELGCTGPQTDPAVRKAIYDGLNRTQLNALAFQDTASEISPAFALLERGQDRPSPASSARRCAPMSPDVAKATKLLEGAGYAKGADGIYAKDGKPLSLTVKVVDRLDRLHHRRRHHRRSSCSRSGIKVHAAAALLERVVRRSADQGNFELLIDSVGQGPAPDPYYLYSYFFSSATTAQVGETADPELRAVQRRRGRRRAGRAQAHQSRGHRGPAAALRRDPDADRGGHAVHPGADRWHDQRVQRDEVHRLADEGRPLRVPGGVVEAGQRRRST